MADVRIPDSILPGETVRIDYEVLIDSQAQVDQVIHSLKQAIWADPRFNYEGSEVKDVYNEDLKRSIRQLSIYATLRATQRESHLPISYASLSTFAAYVKASGIVWAEKVAWVKAKILGVGNWVQEMAETLPQASRNASIAFLLIAAVVAYAWFFGLPKRGN